MICLTTEKLDRTAINLTLTQELLLLNAKKTSRYIQRNQSAETKSKTSRKRTVSST